MINKQAWIACALALTHPLLGAAQSLPAEEPKKKKTTTAARLRLPAGKAAWTVNIPAKDAYWVEAAKTEEQPASEQDAQGQAAQQPEPPGIADNSFLMEEAYNQEYGVVQHISTFSKAINGEGWDFSFTQEWPFNPAPKHQLSYTVTATDPGAPGVGGGIGDVLLHYRYQVIGEGEDAVWFSPRASLLAPSGDSRRGRGAGGVGVQFNLPVSWQVANKLVTHWNAGATIVPRAKNELGDKAGTVGFFLGQSFIYQASPVFNLMLETVFDRGQSVVAPDRAAWESYSVTLNPGFRWAHNFESGLQIVPGIAFPVEVGSAGRGNWGIFLYLSFEHPFGRKAP